MAAFADAELYDNALFLTLKHNIKKIVETGTNDGLNAILLSSLAPYVLTIEVMEDIYKVAVENIKAGGVYLNGVRIDKAPYKNFKIDCKLGSSPQVMNAHITDNDDSILFFLDAHRYDYLPILDELDIIHKKQLKNVVIIIHDFYVPDETGKSKFNGLQIPNTEIYLDFDYIKHKIDDIYGVDNYEYFYSKTSTQQSGVIYIHPKR